MTTPAQTAAINGSWKAGDQCYTTFAEGTAQVSGAYDQNGNCITAQGPGGNSAVNGGQVMNAQGQFTQPYNPPAPPKTGGGGKLTYTPLEPLPYETLVNGVYTGTFAQYLAIIFKLILGLGISVAIVTLVWSFITLMVSDVVNKRSSARRRIEASFFGLGLLLASYLILYNINPNLVKLNLLIDSTTSANGGATPAGQATGQTTVPNPQQLAQQEAACKAQGTYYAFYVDANGQTSCHL